MHNTHNLVSTNYLWKSVFKVIDGRISILSLVIVCENILNSIKIVLFVYSYLFNIIIFFDFV